ncbi:hypothetical protein AB0K89_07415 [Streptomyces cinnamoneus]
MTSGDGLPPEKRCDDCGGTGRTAWEAHDGSRATTSCSGCGGTGKVLA